MPTNTNLGTARSAKKDEFYTQLTDYYAKMKSSIYMKKCLILLLLPMLFCFFSCEKEQVLELESPSNVSVLDNGEAQSLTFSSNQPWTIESSDSWCHVSPSSGDGSNEIITVTVTCDENTSFEGRNTVLTLRSGNRVETITIVQNPREPRSVCIDLKQDTGRDAVLFLLQDSSYFVYENRENESRETLYYNSSLEKDLSEGIIFMKNNVDESLSMTYQGIVVVFNKIEGSTYNLALRTNDGETYYWYGVEMEEPIIDQLNFGFVSTGSTKAIDWHIVKWMGYKFLSFTTTAVATVYGGPLGVASLLLTMHAEYLKSSGQIYEDIDKEYLNDVENLSLFNDLSGSWLGWQLDASWSNLANGWAFLLGTMILNDLADEEYKKIGEIKEDVIPELGDEWNIQITPRKLSCLNNDGQYTAHVKSKAAWKVDDSTVDKSWCHVEKSGDDLIITIKENPEPGFHSCYATVMQSVEYIYHINPVRFDIEMENAKFSVHPQELVFDSEGGTQTVAVSKSDNMIGWDIYMDRIPQWCTVSKNVANSSFDVTVGPSTTGHDAESIIVFGALDETTFYEYTVTVRQEKDPEEQLWQKLVQFYNDTGGPTTWKYRDNWCSDKPLQEWYGIYFDEQGFMTLDLHGNNLTNGGSLDGIDILKSVDVGSSWGVNYLEYLSISGCRSLALLDCDGNQLKTLDASGCTSLVELSCTSNQLQSLNIDGCNSLARLWCMTNQLSSLSVSGLPSLIELNCEHNQLTSLDVSGCSLIERISCGYNQIISLEISDLNHLLTIGCSPNPITDLNVTNCKSLTNVGIGGDSLKKVNVSGCTSLTRIYVTTDWWYFAVGHGDSIGFMGEVLESFDVSGCTGLEYFHIVCPTFTSVNVSGCTSLKDLTISGTQITSLDASNLPELTDLNCTSNMLTSLNVSGCPSLGLIDCFNNQITSIDVSGCPSLFRLWCTDNHINQQITNEDKLSTFYYDVKYYYQQKWDPAQGKYITTYTENPYGWYYPGEPEKGYHGR